MDDLGSIFHIFIYTTINDKEATEITQSFDSSKSIEFVFGNNFCSVEDGVKKKDIEKIGIDPKFTIGVDLSQIRGVSTLIVGQQQDFPEISPKKLISLISN